MCTTKYWKYQFLLSGYWSLGLFCCGNLKFCSCYISNLMWLDNRRESVFMNLICSISMHSFIPLACAECDDSLPFSGASSIPLCCVLFPATLLHQLFFQPFSLHPAIYFLAYFSILLFPNSYIIPFWEFYFLPFSVHAQTNIVYLTLLSPLY